MDDQLQQLIELQKEQNQLLKKYLWRFRFSLLFLLLLTTATAIGLGILVYRDQSKVVPAAPITVWSAAPTATLRPGTSGLDFKQSPSDLYELLVEPQGSGLKSVD
jgi:hypothetical protein